MNNLTEDLLIMHIERGVLQYIEENYTLIESAQIVIEHGARWRERAIEVIHEIEDVEAWLEGERVGHYINPQCSQIMEKVDLIIKEHQEEMMGRIM